MYSIRYSHHILIKLDRSGEIFEEYINIQFHENPFSVNQVSACGRTNTTMQMVAFRSFGNEPK
jgi:hypothetical protein